MIFEPACNLCGARDAQTLFNRSSGRGASFEAEATTDIFDNYGRIVSCRSCGLAYRSPREDDETVLRAYECVEDNDYLEERECRSMNAHLSLRSVRRHIPGGRLLDVGCATGYLLNAARLDFEVEGLEPSFRAVRYVREKLKVPVIRGGIESAVPVNAPYDVLTLVDVIEHLPDPAQALKISASWLKPGGLIYLVTPDIGGLAAQALGRYWWGLRPAHLFYFDKKHCPACSVRRDSTSWMSAASAASSQPATGSAVCPGIPRQCGPSRGF